MLKIYTRTGDDGTTGLLYGGRVAKDSAVMQVTGTVDEAQAAMGMARAEAELRFSELDGLLTRLERELYVLMAEVATDPSHRSKLVAGTTLVTEEMVAALEVQIDDLISRVHHADRVRDPGGEPGLGRPRPGPHHRPPGRTPAGVVARSRAHWSGATSTGCPTCCGPWPAGPRATSTCWPGALHGAVVPSTPTDPVLYPHLPPGAPT